MDWLSVTQKKNLLQKGIHIRVEGVASKVVSMMRKRAARNHNQGVLLHLLVDVVRETANSGVENVGGKHVTRYYASWL